MIRSIDEARALLGVAADTTPAAVAQAYRRLARVTHPDVSPAPDAAERFAAVCAAHDLLQHVAGHPAPDPTEADSVAGPTASRPVAEPLVRQGSAVRRSSSPLKGAGGYFGRPEPVIVAGPVTVRPSNPTTRRPGWTGGR